MIMFMFMFTDGGYNHYTGKDINEAMVKFNEFNSDGRYEIQAIVRLKKEEY